MRIASNSAGGGRSTLLLLLLFVTDRLRISLGLNISTPIVEDPNYKMVDLDHREFLMNVDAQREKTSASVTVFRYNSNRVRVISKRQYISKVNNGTLYWMNRDHRVQDNWALLYAQKSALLKKVPLHVVFFRPSSAMDVFYRQYKFMISGLKKVELECQNLNIEFHFLFGNSTETLAHFVRNQNIGSIIVDFSPLRDDINMLNQFVREIGSEVPVRQIDAHNIVPCWIMGRRQYIEQSIFRRRMYKNLDAYITEFPPVIKHPYTAYPKARPTDWKILLSNPEIDRSVGSVFGFKAGYIHAMSFLNIFIKKKLLKYHLNRLNPLIDGLSKLSPWLHFGQISAQRVLLEVMKLNNTHPSGVRAYRTEMLLKREMYENYCYTNSMYDSIEGGPAWGRETLNEHRNDERKSVYTREQFENGKIYDKLWKATHNQMKNEGMPHRFLRPYWAKKILQFSKTPEEAIATANYLNNKYSMDGNDPSGYGGVLSAMTGLYDELCPEKFIFGKIRFENSVRLRYKFNAFGYIGRWLNESKIKLTQK